MTEDRIAVLVSAQPDANVQVPPSQALQDNANAADLDPCAARKVNR
jgi:hypothetical protein